MAALLGDDGTFDTVIYCSECGQEQRYNYDASDQDTSEVESLIEDNMRDLKLSRQAAKDSVNEYLYDQWVDWCLEDFESEHECVTEAEQSQFYIKFETWQKDTEDTE